MAHTIISGQTSVIYGKQMTSNILKFTRRQQSIENSANEFVVTKENWQKTYGGEIGITLNRNGQQFEATIPIFFHICYPMHVEMDNETYEQWKETYSNYQQDERMIFVPNNEEEGGI